ncbi:hypothetical protein U27_04723 [Candidatus Vecturithrix granuli]|uniref:Uncharacterized protein n=1 Tax=Vecturithrix granuli TaxID=1499967 RepID=A0A081BZK1_VECG1|nr:hypothetical protein U27_04723 [Candidatus Vecturithrix granuli]
MRRIVMIAMLIISLFWCFWQTSINASTKVEQDSIFIEDEEYHFSLRIPKNWEFEQAKESNSLWRLSATPPDKKLQVAIYSIRVGDDIDLQKLEEQDHKLFEHLGEVYEKNQFTKALFKKWKIGLIGEIFLDVIEVEKRYKPGRTGLYGLARFTTSGTYGYIMLAYSATNEFSQAIPIFDSFQENVSMLANFKNKWAAIREKGIFSSVFGWIGGIIAVLVIIGILYLIGTSGKMVREGIEIKKVLKKARIEVKQKGGTLTPKYHEFKKKANKKIIIPILIWAIVYGIIFFFVPVKVFLVLLGALIVPILGFFGIFFVPSDAPEDYFPDMF